MSEWCKRRYVTIAQSAAFLSQANRINRCSQLYSNVFRVWGKRSRGTIKLRYLTSEATRKKSEEWNSMQLITLMGCKCLIDVTLHQVRVGGCPAIEYRHRSHETESTSLCLRITSLLSLQVDEQWFCSLRRRYCAVLYESIRMFSRSFIWIKPILFYCTYQLILA